MNATPIRALALRLLPFALASLTAACGGEGGGGPADQSPCEAMREECFAVQKVCVDDGAEPHCDACGLGQYAASSGKCEAIGGTPLAHDFDDFTTESGEEVLGLCQSWTLLNAEEIWVNAVELEQDVASHHSNWMYVPGDKYEGPDGVWPCKDRNYSQLTAALAGGVLYAQSTQATHEVQKFPNGAAVRIPPYSRIIGDVHLLNTTDQAITGHAKLTVYAMELADVEVKLTPFHMTYEGLDIPPHATSRFTGECNLDTQFAAVSGKIFDMKLYYALPHTHALGTRFFFELMGGPNDGQSLIDVSGFNGEARGRAYDPPIDLKGGVGLRFGCEFTNPRPESVGWGFGDQEMCEMLGFAESKVGFESSVGSADPGGTDGDTQLFTGPCDTLAFEWTNDKPGGPPP